MSTPEWAASALSEVRGWPGHRTRGLGVLTSPSHGEDRQFKSGRVHFQNILTVIFPVFSWEMVDLRGILVIVVIERQLIWGFRLIFWNASVDRVVRNMVFGVSTILSGYASIAKTIAQEDIQDVGID